MQEKLDEAHTAIIQEKEAAKLAIEQAPPVIKEVPVVDNTQLELLNSQNNELEVNFELQVPLTSRYFSWYNIFKTQVEVAKLKGKIEEFEAKCSALERDGKANLTEAEDAKSKAIQFQEIIERYRFYWFLKALKSHFCFTGLTSIVGKLQITYKPVKPWIRKSGLAPAGFGRFNKRRRGWRVKQVQSWRNFLSLVHSFSSLRHSCVNLKNFQSTWITN